jgi:hypothetical protein
VASNASHAAHDKNYCIRQKRSRALSSSPLVIAAAKQAHMFVKKHVWEEVAILAAARFDSTSCKLGFEGDGK